MLGLNSFKGRPLALALVVALVLLHLGIVLFNHYYFRTFAYYYGVYNFAFFDFAHFRNSSCPIYFDGSHASFLQDHFSLFLVLISPLYFVFQSLTGTYTLLIIQWIAIIYGAWATFKLIELRSTKFQMAFLALLTYLIMYCRFSSYQADCNLAIIGSALVPVFLYYFEKGKRTPLWIIFFTLLITREDFSLWLAFICLALFIINRKNRRQRNMATLLLVLSISFFVIIFNWIIPSLETERIRFALFNYGALGKTPVEAAKAILTHPLHSLKLLFVNHLDDPSYDWIKTKFYLVFIFSGGIFLLLRPVYLICLIPLIAKKMFNDDPIRWGYETYYGVEMASILPALVFATLSDLKRATLSFRVSLMAFGMALLTTLFCFWIVNYPMTFTKFEFYRSWYFQHDLPVRALHRELRKIPESAAICASGRILPHLSMREKIYYFPSVNDAEYICLCLYADSWPLDNDTFAEEVNKYKASVDWEILYEKDNAIIFKKMLK